MSDTFSVGWDSSEVTEGLDDVIAKIDQVEEAGEKLEETGQGVVDSLERQITVVHKQASDWKTLGMVALPVLGQITHDSIHLAESLNETAHAGAHFAFEMGGEAVRSVLRMAEATVKYTLLTKGAVATIGAFRGETRESTKEVEKQGESFVWTAAKASALGVGIAMLTGQFKAGDAAASAMGIGIKSALAGSGPVLVGVAAGLSAYTAALRVTGERTDEFGKKSTNYDRVSVASERLFGNIRASLPTLQDFGIGLENAASKLPVVDRLLLNVSQTWTEFDKSVTRGADNLRDNIAVMASWVGAAGDLERQNARMDKIRAEEVGHFKALAEASNLAAQAVRNRYDAERSAEVGTVHTSQEGTRKQEMLEVYDADVDQERKTQAELIGNLQRMKDGLDGSAKKEREYAVAVIETRAALEKSNKAMDEAIEARRILAHMPLGDVDLKPAFAKMNQYEEAARQSVLREVQRLQDAVGQKLISAQEYASQKAVLDAKEEQIHRESLRRMVNEQKAFYDEQRKLAKDAAEANYQIDRELSERRNVLVRRQAAFDRNIVTFERDYALDQQRLVLQRTAEGLKDDAEGRAMHHSLKQKMILQERDQALFVIDDELAQAKKSLTNKRDIEDAEFEANKRRQSAILSGERRLRDEEIRYAEEVRDRKKKAGEKEVADAKEKAAALKKAAEDKEADVVDKAGLDAGAILKAQDPRAVRKNVIAAAQKKAAAEFKKKNAGLLTATPEMDKIRGTIAETQDEWYGAAVRSDERSQAAARKKYDAGLRRAQQEAASRAGRDFAKGKSAPEDTAEAQAEAAKKTISQMLANGQLQSDVAQALMKQVQVAASQQANIEQIDQAVKNLQKGQEAVLKASDNVRARAGGFRG